MFDPPPRWLEELTKDSRPLEKAIHGDRLDVTDVEGLLNAPFHPLAAAADYYARSVKGNRGAASLGTYMLHTPTYA